MTEEKLPSVSDRVKAIFADSVIIVLSMFLFSYLFSFIGEVSGKIKGMTFITLFFLYDPLMTYFFAGTIGHRMFELRVKCDANQNENLWLPLTFVRFFFKIFLGWLSLITVTGNKKHKAIHDMIVGSIVIYKA